MTMLMDQLFTCPNCEVIFQSKVAGSYDTFGRKYSDFYVGSSSDPQPILHLNNICPKCGFAAYTIDFKVFSIDLDIVKNAIIETEKFSGRKATEFNAGDGFILISKYLENEISKESLVFVLLQANYAYRELDDQKLDESRKLTLETVESVLEKELYKENPVELFLYLAGELNRLLDNNEMSLKYFKEALEKAEKTSRISKITQQQLTKPSEIIPEGFFD
ncbi:MAG: DUF2225 domain-containing protein [Candidatus Heimdallarchaeota archaeon]|nr:DUF2225 domain-containing protein [Candidatus Heimdallarchaeota archaeon]MBY8993800.1 DUF2225 domain-containing protein [Candidatus Heimdallarchaeota archaeon]